MESYRELLLETMYSTDFGSVTAEVYFGKKSIDFEWEIW